MTLKDVLGAFDTVDFLESDCQQSEILIFPPNMDLLKRKVRRVHIGTHGKNLHNALFELFQACGWEIVFSYEPDTTHSTALGSFATKDGKLTARNPSI